MHICIDLHDISGTGGIEKVATGLVNYLVQHGHQITCFTTSASGTSSRFPLHPSIEVKHYPFTGDASTIIPLREQVCLCSPDIFISTCSCNNILLWCAVLSDTDIPLVYSEHNDPWKIESERWNQPERQAALWAADAVHLLLPPYLRSVPESLRHKCHIIGNPVLPTTIERSPHPGGPYILSLGRLAAVKQVPLLVQAFDLLAAEFPQWELHIWGNGEEENTIRRAVARTSCNKRIRMCGLTREPEKQFSEADIFCIPSRFEGLPVALLEAMSAGVPSIGFEKCLAISSLIQNEKNGLLSPEMTAASLAQSLRRLMQDADLRQRMGTAARESAKAFAPELIYNQWEAMLFQAVARKGQTQLSRLYDDSILSPEEEAWRKTMRAVLKRPNVLLQNRQIFRRFLRRHPA